MIYGNVELYNVEEAVPLEDGSGVRLSRVAARVRESLNGGAQNAAFYGCGCEIRFNMTGDRVRLKLRRRTAEARQITTGIAEIYYGPFQGPYWVSPAFIRTDDSEIVIDKPENLEKLRQVAKEQHLPYDPAMVRVILPYDAANDLLALEGDTLPPKPAQSPEMKYLAYGSSITHGGSAVHPFGCYAMRTAQKLGADLINLGFAGSAQLEPEMADYIAQRRDWDFATLELGVNVVEIWDEETFREKVDDFLTRIAEKNRDRWIFCIDMFQFERDYRRDRKAACFREIIKGKVEALCCPKLVHVPGEALIEGWAGLSADLLHPSESGMGQIADKLADLMAAKLTS